MSHSIYERSGRSFVPHKSGRAAARALMYVLGVSLFTSWAPISHAFKPNDSGHEGITRQALSGISRTVDRDATIHPARD